jgi:hypothetical protein
MNETDYPFVGFYNGKQVEVEARTSYDAQQIVAKLLNVKKSQQHMISVLRADVTHSTAIF